MIILKFFLLGVLRGGGRVCAPVHYAPPFEIHGPGDSYPGPFPGALRVTRVPLGPCTKLCTFYIDMYFFKKNNVLLFLAEACLAALGVSERPQFIFWTF